MPTHNGASNGVNNSNHRGADDFDSISGTSPQMMMLDETATTNGRRSSRDSLTSEGKDNPAFEADHDHNGTNGKTPEKNGGGKTNGTNGQTNGTNGHQPTPKATAKTVERVNGDNVEMMPLNPAGVNHQHNNHRSPHPQGKSTPTNGASNKTNSKESKQPLDIPNNDYFRPVNNKRKLFRGQKLYVTSDQRSDGRRWKWIAFWGGVFTFVAAALLTGILAATGIIMSKSTPSYGPPNELFGNFSSNESYSGFEGFNELNSSTVNKSVSIDTEPTNKTVTSVEPPMSPPDLMHEFNFTIPFLTDHPNMITDEHQTTVSTTPMATHSEVTIPTMTSVPFAVIPTVLNSSSGDVKVNDSLVGPTVDGRARSLDEEITIIPVDSETLFPEIENIPPLEEENVTASASPNPTDSIRPDTESAIFNDTDDESTTNHTILVENTNRPTLFENTSHSTPFENPLPTPIADSVTNLFEITQPPPSSPLPDFVSTPTFNLWNESVIDGNPSLIDELDDGSANDSLTTNSTDVLEERANVGNTTSHPEQVGNSTEKNLLESGVEHVLEKENVSTSSSDNKSLSSNASIPEEVNETVSSTIPETSNDNAQENNSSLEIVNTEDERTSEGEQSRNAISTTFNTLNVSETKFEDKQNESTELPPVSPDVLNSTWLRRDQLTPSPETILLNTTEVTHNSTLSAEEHRANETESTTTL